VTLFLSLLTSQVLFSTIEGAIGIEYGNHLNFRIPADVPGLTSWEA
jgi:hypothetical protein